MINEKIFPTNDEDDTSQFSWDEYITQFLKFNLIQIKL
jgi:hypothetical protein